MNQDLSGAQSIACDALAVIDFFDGVTEMTIGRPPMILDWHLQCLG